MNTNTLGAPHTVVIVGGGFAGIRSALDVARHGGAMRIILLSNKNHFEYYPRIYRVVTGESPLQVCVPLDVIFKNTAVEVVNDTVTGVDVTNKKVTCKNGEVYSYDDLVLGLGSETVYFNIEGVRERSFGFKSISEALALKKHLHQMFKVHLSAKKEDLIEQLHIVVVGGGPSGVELAGELTRYMRNLAREHAVDTNFVTIDLIEAAPRLAPMLPENVSARIYGRLHSLGVNVFLNRTVMKEDVDEIFMKDMSMKSNTLIWTAGSRTNNFYTTIAGLTMAKNGRVEVDEHMQAKGVQNVYIAGDAANTPYAGLAQTAMHDGTYIARVIILKQAGKSIPSYVPKKVSYAMPLGTRWAAVSTGPFQFYGFFAWIIRELADLRFFASILPLRKAFAIFSNHAICESCTTCGAQSVK